MLNRELVVAIPASFVSDVPHLREKTLKTGVVARAAAIFRVDEIIVFSDAPDKDQTREIEFIDKILSYIETPQYLRKRLFKIRPELKYVGVLPPLRTPHHPRPNQVKNLIDGEYREGVAVAHLRHGTLVDVGVEAKALLRNKKLPMNTRVTVKLMKSRKLSAKLVNRSAIPQYWGYRITPSKMSLGVLMEKHSFDLTIATSKHGKPVRKVSETLANRLRKAARVLVAFGAPSQGLYELARSERWDLESVFDFVINTIPHQGVETVRTEEALLVSLGILNSLRAKG